MFSSAALAQGSESSRPVGVAFCILGFSVTVQVHHRALTGTHECCFVSVGTSSPPQEGGGREGRGVLVQKTWSDSYLLKKCIERIVSLTVFKNYGQIHCGQACVCLICDEK